MRAAGKSSHSALPVCSDGIIDCRLHAPTPFFEYIDLPLHAPLSRSYALYRSSPAT